MANFQSFTGIITMIDDFWTGDGCTKLIEVTTEDGGPIHFIVTPTTYFVDHVMVTAGDRVTGFYDADVVTILIYPPQLRAIVMAKTAPGQSVKVDFFDYRLRSSAGALQLNIGPQTQILLENGQLFPGNPANRYLIVVYGATTRSIPAQTTPEQIVVMC